MASPVSRLPLMEQFYTIQGEGYNTGQASFFIRLGGCDVGCVWCDVKNSWDENKHPLVSIGSMVNNAMKHPSRAVVITGGEPLLYNLDELCTRFRKEKFKTYLETSGAYPLSGMWDWICLSPKKFKPPLPEVVKATDELKIIVYNSSDFKWAEKFRKNVKPGCKLFLQPEYGVFNIVMPLIVDYVKECPDWKISLQTHKVMNIP